MDGTRSQIVIYEPMPDGHLRLIGADFLVIATDWDKAHPGQPPQLHGTVLSLFREPQSLRPPAFYTLHVWAWKENPNGAFVNWQPRFHAKHSLANSLRAPYFHDGSAATLLDAVNFCDGRFNLLLSDKDKNYLSTFLVAP